MYDLMNSIAQEVQSGPRKDLYRLLNECDQYDVTLSTSDSRVFKGRNGQDIIDFASGNYLGFDKRQRELLPQAIKAAEKYGLHTGRARLTGAFDMCGQLEDRLARFTGAETSLIVTNTFLGCIGIIPALIGKDDLVVMDKSAHAIMFHGAQLARDKGAILQSYPHGDLDKLEHILKTHKKARHKMICLDGVYSITGNYVNLKELQRLAKKYNALLFVDDAHGFGMLGKKSLNHYGDGSGIVNYLDLSYENIFYIAGCAKNMSAALAFACVSEKMKKTLLAFSKPLDYSQQPIPFSFGLLNASLDLLEKEGNEIKTDIYQKTSTLNESLHRNGFDTLSDNSFPIVSVKINNTEKLIWFSKKLYNDYGIHITACPYPTVSKGDECIRITVTAKNTMDQVNYLANAFIEHKTDLLL